MSNVLPSVPTSFTIQPFADQWFSWADVEACFWPGRGKRAIAINPVLAPVRGRGGVYALAWSAKAPRRVHPAAAAVQYVGESGWFCRRMEQFGNSAGFWGKRSNGHSAGWRWPKGQTHNLWIAFFPIDDSLPDHIARGMRVWLEGLALEEHRLCNGALPQINGTKKGKVAQF